MDRWISAEKRKGHDELMRERKARTNKWVEDLSDLFASAKADKELYMKKAYELHIRNAYELYTLFIENYIEDAWEKDRKREQEIDEERKQRENEEIKAYKERQAAKAASEKAEQALRVTMERLEKKRARQARHRYNDLVLHVVSNSTEANHPDAVEYEYNAYGFRKLSPGFLDNKVFKPVMRL